MPVRWSISRLVQRTLIKGIATVSSLFVSFICLHRQYVCIGARCAIKSYMSYIIAQGRSRVACQLWFNAKPVFCPFCYFSLQPCTRTEIRIMSRECLAELHFVYRTPTQHIIERDVVFSSMFCLRDENPYADPIQVLHWGIGLPNVDRSPVAMILWRIHWNEMKGFSLESKLIIYRGKIFIWCGCCILCVPLSQIESSWNHVILSYKNPTTMRI